MKQVENYVHRMFEKKTPKLPVNLSQNDLADVKTRLQNRFKDTYDKDDLIIRHKWFSDIIYVGYAGTIILLCSKMQIFDLLTEHKVFLVRVIMSWAFLLSMVKVEFFLSVI